MKTNATYRSRTSTAFARRGSGRSSLEKGRRHRQGNEEDPVPPRWHHLALRAVLRSNIHMANSAARNRYGTRRIRLTLRQPGIDEQACQTVLSALRHNWPRLGLGLRHPPCGSKCFDQKQLCAQGGPGPPVTVDSGHQIARPLAGLGGSAGESLADNSRTAESSSSSAMAVAIPSSRDRAYRSQPRGVRRRDRYPQPNPLIGDARGKTWKLQILCRLHPVGEAIRGRIAVARGGLDECARHISGRHVVHGATLGSKRIAFLQQPACLGELTSLV